MKYIVIGVVSISLLLLVTLLGLLSAGLVIDYQHFSKLYNASPEEIEQICNSDWYQNKTVETLPAKCTTIKKY